MNHFTSSLWNIVLAPTNHFFSKLVLTLSLQSKFRMITVCDAVKKLILGFIYVAATRQTITWKLLFNIFCQKILFFSTGFCVKSADGCRCHDAFNKERNEKSVRKKGKSTRISITQIPSLLRKKISFFITEIFKRKDESRFSFFHPMNDKKQKRKFVRPKKNMSLIQDTKLRLCLSAWLIQ